MTIEQPSEQRILESEKTERALIGSLKQSIKDAAVVLREAKLNVRSLKGNASVEQSRLSNDRCHERGRQVVYAIVRGHTNIAKRLNDPTLDGHASDGTEDTNGACKCGRSHWNHVYYIERAWRNAVASLGEIEPPVSIPEGLIAYAPNILRK